METEKEVEETVKKKKKKEERNSRGKSFVKREMGNGSGRRIINAIQSFLQFENKS